MPLESINQPSDLARLSYPELEELAGEIRDFIVQAVAAAGGHLGSNLGAVELTLALHRVFNSPRDAILWDTGHQAYVHKIVTGNHYWLDGLGGLVTLGAGFLAGHGLESWNQRRLARRRAARLSATLPADQKMA